MNDSAIHYWAVVNRGLEAVAHDEILALVPDAHEVVVAYRRVHFATAAEPASLLALRTVDDLFVDLGRWEGIDRPRSTLQRMTDLAYALDLRDAAAICTSVRELGTPPTCSVTANFVGRRNYSTDEIKIAVAQGVEGSHGWAYQESDNDADLNLRVFIEHEQAFVGLRLAARPLQERAYKVANIAGSLKPAVAAAMIRLGGFSPGATIVDPFAGAGTIPIEAALVGLAALGGELDAAARAAAERNREAAGIDIRLEAWDARAIPLADHSVDGVVTNLPWGRQVEVDEQIDGLYHACIGEIARIVRRDGRIVTLTSLQPLLHQAAVAAGLTLEAEIEISLSGQTPRISVWTTAP